MTDDDEGSPYRGHVDRFNQLPLSTRAWIERLRPADLKRIDKALDTLDRITDRGKFLAWILMSVLGIFLGFGAFSDQVIRWLNYFRGHP